MPEPKTPWDRDETTQPGTVTREEHVLGSEANKMDAIIHPLRNEKTPPYGINIPPEIRKAVQRAKQDTTTGGVASLTVAEIAAHERARYQSKTPDAAILRRPTKK